MNWYRVRLNGQKFLLNFDGESKRVGFYTTRDVKADSFEDAEMKAVNLIKNDDFLIENILNESADSPMIYVNDIKILDAAEERLKNIGFSFYIEENENS